MSSNLYIEPAYREKKSLSTELKFAARKRYGQPINAKLTESDIAYFQGLVDAGIKDAQIVLDMINQHNEVSFEEQY